MRVLVCGGRDLDSVDVFNWLEAYLRDEIAHATGLSSSLTIRAIIHGAARGADEGAALWGKSEHVKVIPFPADWKKHEKSAGPIRNYRMIVEGKPDIVVAFPGGRGTADMVRQAKEHGVKVVEVETFHA